MKKMPRLAILGSGRGRNLAALYKTLEKGEVSAEIALVISDVAESRILSLAREHRSPTFFINPGAYKTKLITSAQEILLEKLQKENIDLIILTGFMRLIKEPLLSAFPNQIINIHPSLLPDFPGLKAWEQALNAGVKETGCTVHYVDAGMDTGEVIAQEKVAIFPEDTPEILHARIEKKENILLPRVIKKLLKERIPA